MNKQRLLGKIALSIALATPATPVIGGNTQTPMPSREIQKEIDALLSEQLQALLGSDKALTPAQQKSRSSASIDYATGSLTIDLGKEFIPKEDVAEDEDLRGWLAMSLIAIIQDTVTVKEIKFLYDGKSAYFYHPSQLPRPEPL